MILESRTTKKNIWNSVEVQASGSDVRYLYYKHYNRILVLKVALSRELDLKTTIVSYVLFIFCKRRVHIEPLMVIGLGATL
jgi:hypothetical protein